MKALSGKRAVVAAFGLAVAGLAIFFALLEFSPPVPLMRDFVARLDGAAAATGQIRSALLAVNFAAILVLAGSFIAVYLFLLARLKAERALRRTEQQFRLMVGSLTDFAIFMLDSQGFVSSWTNGAARIEGYRAAEIIGKHFSCFYPEDDLKSDKPRQELDVASRWGSFEGESWRLRKDGSRFWAKILITAVKDEEGSLLGFVQVANDITARMEANASSQRSQLLLKEELREREQTESKFRALVEAAPDALFVIDHEGKIVLANEQVERLFGYRRSELLGHGIEKLMPERFRHVHVEHRTRFLTEPSARAAVAHLELCGLRKDDREFPAEMNLRALATDRGLWITSSIRDITEQKDREGALRSLSARLLHVQEEERRRVARELHDSTGQYLSVLLMGLNSLKSKMGAENHGATLTLAECIRIAEESTKEVRTASYLLYPPMLEELGLKSAVPSYLEGFARRSGIRSTCEISADVCRLPLEAEVAIFRVLQEGLTNVHRHSASPIVRVRLSMANEMEVLTIQDEGRGIPAERLEQFQQEVPGMIGVGLRGMNERMRQLGGRLAVKSTSEGTTVTAMLPCATTPPTAVVSIDGVGGRRRRPALTNAKFQSCGCSLAPEQTACPQEHTVEQTTKAAAEVAGRERIGQRAYELYIERGGGEGRDVEDWIAAERELTECADETWMRPTSRGGTALRH